MLSTYFKRFFVSAPNFVNHRPVWHSRRMELFEAISDRRTIKHFKSDPVPPEVLERALAAGLWAQNHKLTEPWRFTVLGPATHRRLAEAFAHEQAARAGSETDAARVAQVRNDAMEKILSKPCVVAVGQRLAGNAGSIDLSMQTWPPREARGYCRWTTRTPVGLPPECARTGYSRLRAC